MSKVTLTESQVKAAYAIAIFADLLQLPLTAASATIVLTIPSEIVDFTVDCIVMIAVSRFLGFHWLLLPSMIGESIPGLELLPTWTGCVACVVKIRRDEQAKTTGDSYATAQESGANGAKSGFVIIPPLPPPLDAAIEKRLNKLMALRKQNLISQEEYDAKRGQILAEL